MKFGRRLAAVGMLTGGLLLVGLAAPSLADVTTLGTPDTSSSVVTTDAGTGAGDITQDVSQPSETVASARIGAATAVDGPVPLANGIVLDQQCNPGQDDNCVPPGVCVPEDYNGGDAGCGTAPAPADPCAGISIPTQDCPVEDFCQVPDNQDNPVCIVDNGGGGGGNQDPCAATPVPTTDCPIKDFCQVPDNQDNALCLLDNGNGNGNGGGTTAPPPPTSGGNLPPSTTPPAYSGGIPAGSAPGSSGRGGRGGRGKAGPGTGAGGSASSNGSSSEGTVPGGHVRGTGSPGTSACGDPAVCNDSGILGVDATLSTPTVTAPSTASTTTSGDVLPQTGAPQGTRGLVLLGFGLLAGGVLMVRPRRLARHKA